MPSAPTSSPLLLQHLAPSVLAFLLPGGAPSADAPLDATPPVLRLRGRPRTAVPQFEPFVDPGAYAEDAVDGALPVSVTGLEAVDTWKLTAPGQPGQLITYVATDSAGNTATATREVVVISPCADGDALCMRLSERCAMVSRTLCPPELLALALGLGGEQSRAQAPLVELADSGSILPVALLLGECHPPSCEVGVLPGVNVPAQVHHITVGTPFQDPGVDVTVRGEDAMARVERSFSPGLWSSAEPTPEGRPYVIKYTVAVPAGVQRIVAARLIYVSCPPEERVCEGGGEDAAGLACSLGGSCALPLLEPVAAEFERANGNYVDERAGALVSSLHLELIGPSVVRLPMGSGYGLCPLPMMDASACEAGVVASSAVSGDLSSHVQVCPDNPLEGGNLLIGVGLAPCSIDTTVRGAYTIHYQVSDPAVPSGPAASITRTVLVLPDCPPGEHACASDPELPCSQSGICASDLGSLTPLTSLTGDEGAIAIALVGPPAIEVPQNRLYVACTDGDLSFCDAGATAVGPAGEDLTAAVLALPAELSVAEACAEPGACDTYRFASHGLRGCGIDTSAPVGTIHVIQFALLPLDGSSATPTSVTRTIVVVEDPVSCAAAGLHDCGDGIVCSPVDCALRTALLADLGTAVTAEDSAEAVLELLPFPGAGSDPAAMTLEYGSPLPAPDTDGEAPCDEGSGVPMLRCWAAAWAVAADGSRRALASDRIQVTEVPADGQPRCSPAAMGAGPPWCLPAAYTYNYTLRSADETAAVAWAVRTVTVEWRAVAQLRLRLPLLPTADGQPYDPTAGLAEAIPAAVLALLPDVLAYAVVEATAPGEGGGLLQMALRLELSSASLLWEGHGGAARAAAAAALEELAALRPAALAELLPPGPPLRGAVNWEAAAAAMEPGEKSPPLDLKGGRYASLTASVEALELELGSLGERLVRLMGSAEMGALQLPPEDVEVEALAVLQALLGVSSAVGSTEATLVEALRELLPPGWLQRSPGQLSNLGDAIDRMGFSHGSVLLALERAAQSGVPGNADFESAAESASPLPYNHPIFTVPNAHRRYVVQFTTEGPPPSTPPSQAGRRVLLQSSATPEVDVIGKSAGDAVTGAAPGESWNGYVLGTAHPVARAKETLAPRPRWYGAASGSNVLLGGVKLHMTRQRTDYAACEDALPSLAAKRGGGAILPLGGRRFSQFMSACNTLATALAGQSGSQEEGGYVQQLLAEAEPLHPYGRDPAFMLSSELYNWRLKGLEGRYYNLSAGVLGERAGDRDPEVNLFGNPYGWFSARLPGTPDGFPLVVESGVPAERADQVVQAMRDGGFWDIRSRDLSFESLSFNPRLELFAYVRALYSQALDGSIRYKIAQLETIPSLDRRALPVHAVVTAIFLAVSAAVFLVQGGAVAPLRRALARATERLRLWLRLRRASMHSEATLAGLPSGRHSFRRAPSRAPSSRASIAASTPRGSVFGDDPNGDEAGPSSAQHGRPAVSFTFLSMGAIFSACAALAVVSLSGGLAAEPRLAYRVYDAAAFAPVRYFLPKKSAEGVEAIAGATCPGCPERWRLDSNMTGLQAMASDLQELRALALQRDAFTSLTGMALMLSIGALIGSWSWQPRVTFLTANLAAVAGDLLALLLTSACCIFMYTAWGHMLLGDVYGPFSTFQGALHQLVDAFVSGGGDLGGVHAAAFTHARETLPIVRLLQIVYYVSLMLLVIIVIPTFMVALFGFTPQHFIQSDEEPGKTSMSDLPGIPTQLAELLLDTRLRMTGRGVRRDVIAQLLEYVAEERRLEEEADAVFADTDASPGPRNKLNALLMAAKFGQAMSSGLNSPQWSQFLSSKSLRSSAGEPSASTAASLQDLEFYLKESRSRSQGTGFERSFARQASRRELGDHSAASAGAAACDAGAGGRHAPACRRNSTGNLGRLASGRRNPPERGISRLSAGLAQSFKRLAGTGYRSGGAASGAGLPSEGRGRQLRSRLSVRLPSALSMRWRPADPESDLDGEGREASVQTIAATLLRTLGADATTDILHNGQPNAAEVAANLSGPYQDSAKYISSAPFHAAIRAVERHTQLAMGQLRALQVWQRDIAKMSGVLHGLVRRFGAHGPPLPGAPGQHSDGDVNGQGRHRTARDAGTGRPRRSITWTDLGSGVDGRGNLEPTPPTGDAEPSRDAPLHMPAPADRIPPRHLPARLARASLSRLNLMSRSASSPGIQELGIPECSTRPTAGGMPAPIFMHGAAEVNTDAGAADARSGSRLRTGDTGTDIPVRSATSSDVASHGMAPQPARHGPTSPDSALEPSWTSLELPENRANDELEHLAFGRDRADSGRIAPKRLASQSSLLLNQEQFRPVTAPSVHTSKNWGEGALRAGYSRGQAAEAAPFQNLGDDGAEGDPLLPEDTVNAQLGRLAGPVDAEGTWPGRSPAHHRYQATPRHSGSKKSTIVNPMEQRPGTAPGRSASFRWDDGNDFEETAM